MNHAPDTGRNPTRWWRLPMFEGVRPLERQRIPPDILAGVALALPRVSPSLRRDLDRLSLMEVLGRDPLLDSRDACLAAYQVAWAEPSQGTPRTG